MSHLLEFDYSFASQKLLEQRDKEISLESVLEGLKKNREIIDGAHKAKADVADKSAKDKKKTSSSSTSESTKGKTASAHQATSGEPQNQCSLCNLPHSEDKCPKRKQQIANQARQAGTKLPGQPKGNQTPRTEQVASTATKNEERRCFLCEGMKMPMSVVLSHNADQCRIFKLNKQPDTRDKDQKGSQQPGPNNNRGEPSGQQQYTLAPQVSPARKYFLPSSTTRQATSTGQRVLQSEHHGGYQIQDGHRYQQMHNTNQLGGQPQTLIVPTGHTRSIASANSSQTTIVSNVGNPSYQQTTPIYHHPEYGPMVQQPTINTMCVSDQGMTAGGISIQVEQPAINGQGTANIATAETSEESGFYQPYNKFLPRGCSYTATTAQDTKGAESEDTVEDDSEHEDDAYEQGGRVFCRCMKTLRQLPPWILQRTAEAVPAQFDGKKSAIINQQIIDNAKTLVAEQVQNGAELRHERLQMVSVSVDGHGQCFISARNLHNSVTTKPSIVRKQLLNHFKRNQSEMIGLKTTQEIFMEEYGIDL